MLTSFLPSSPVKIDFELVGPEAIENSLAGTRQGEAPVVLEANFSSFDHPLEGDLPVKKHLPGAIQIHPSYLEAGTDQSKYYPYYSCPQDGNLLPFPELTAALERLGILPGRSVLVYGTEPDGTMAAARLIWGLLVAGVETIRLLDGGIGTWLACGGETVGTIRRAVEMAEANPAPPAVAASWTMRSDLLATTSEVREISRHPGAAPSKLVDVRKPGEYNGTLTRYYPFFSKAGHIPGAILQGDWINLMEAGTHKIGPALPGVRERWIDLGIIDRDVEEGRTTLTFHCGTGWRSSLSFLVATLLGYQARNFDDGFYGWSWNGSNPVSYVEPAEEALATEHEKA